MPSKKISYENTRLRKVLFDAISGADFEYSCNYYGHNDIEIKILLETLKMDIEMAL